MLAQLNEWYLFPTLLNTAANPASYATVDAYIDARHWADVIWAISTRVDPKRDCVLVDSTPIDYLDFASPVAGLGSKLGIDATTKWPGEVDRAWGRPITMRADVVAKVDRLWSELGLE